MSEEIEVQYPDEILYEEIPRIRESILNAMFPVFEELRILCLRELDLQSGDSEILAQYRVSKAPGTSFHKMTKKPFPARTYPEVVEALAHEAISTGNEDQLRESLAGLNDRVRSSDPFSLQAIAERLLVDGKEGSFLVLNWMPFRLTPFNPATFSAEGHNPPPIQWIEPDAPDFFQRSLCFYSDRALAEIVHLTKGATTRIPLHRWDFEKKRISKIRERLSLRRAGKRIFKEWEFAPDMSWWRLVPFASRLVKKTDKNRP